MEGFGVKKGIYSGKTSLETIPFWEIDCGTLNDGENDGTVIP